MCAVVGMNDHHFMCEALHCAFSCFQYVDVQPDDGFGTLLPLETIELDIVFQPSKARDYNFELTCKSLINR